MSSFWRDRPVLVTGATGLLGGWLVRALVSRGAAVTCLVRDWTPESGLIRSGTVDRVNTVRGDARDCALAERILGENEIDTVFHLAAQTIVGVANRNPMSTFESNVGGTWAMLEACRRSPSVGAIVVASSDKAYGDGGGLPYTESTPLAGRHPYDVSKSCADLIAQSYFSTYRLPLAITRCGNLFGGGDLNWNRIVPGTMRAALRGERPVIRSDGNAVRDYLYVDDAVAAYLRLGEQLALSPDLAGEAFNFANESRITVSELVARILDAAGSGEQPEIRNETRQEIRNQCLSTEKAGKLLGWRPRHSLDDGLRLTVDWYRDFFGCGSRGVAVMKAAANAR